MSTVNKALFLAGLVGTTLGTTYAARSGRTFWTGLGLSLIVSTLGTAATVYVTGRTSA